MPINFAAANSKRTPAERGRILAEGFRDARIALDKRIADGTFRPSTRFFEQDHSDRENIVVASGKSKPKEPEQAKQ